MYKPVPVKALKAVEDFEPKKNGLDLFLKTLQSVEIGEVQTEKDKAIFTQLVQSIKLAKEKIKVKRSEIEGALKPGIKDAEAKVVDLKQALSEKLGPLRAIGDELDRIENASRNSVNAFVNTAIAAAEASVVDGGDPLLPHEKAMIGAPHAEIVHAPGGGTLFFRDASVVKITDIEKIPRRFIDFVAVAGKVSAWLKETLKIEGDLQIKIMADGSAQVRIGTAQLPLKTMDRVGVLESKIVAAGGCDGVEIVSEKKAVVR